MKVSKDFYLTEFVSKNVYEQFGERSIWFVDPRIISVAQFTRDFFGKPIIINNWYDGGKYNYSGFREPKCTVGADLSQHRFGRAIDIKVSGLTSEEVYTAIIKAQEKFMDAGLTTMEDVRDTPTWNHLDCRHTGSGNLLIVRP